MAKILINMKKYFIASSTWGSINFSLCLLMALIVLSFLLGGSSRADASSLIILRPITILIFMYSLTIITKSQLRTYVVPVLFIMSVILLTAAHLIPLPPPIWANLPGRELIYDIMIVAGQQHHWMPLSIAPHSTLNALYFLSGPAAVVLLASFSNGARGQSCILLLIIIAALTSLVGVFQAAGIDIRFYRVNSVMSGVFANRNHQALMLAFTVPLSAYYIFNEKRMNSHVRSHLPIERIIIFLGIILFIFAQIIVTGSRGGVIFFVIAVLMSAAIFIENLMNYIKVSSKYKVIAALISFSGMIWLVWAALTAASRNIVLERFVIVSQKLRTDVWQHVTEIIPMYLPWGSGVGTYVETYQITEPDSLLSAEYSNHAHNDYLEIALTGGFPCLLILLVAFGWLARAVVSAWTPSASLDRLRRLGLIMIIMFAIASAVDYPLRTPALASLFALAMVWAVDTRSAPLGIKR